MIANSISLGLVCGFGFGLALWLGLAWSLGGEVASGEKKKKKKENRNSEAKGLFPFPDFPTKLSTVLAVGAQPPPRIGGGVSRRELKKYRTYCIICARSLTFYGVLVNLNLT